MKKNKTYIIAEIGVNHNGEIKLAKKLMLVAKQLNCDAVKFQAYVSEKIVDKKLSLAKYQKINNLNKQYQLLKKYELSYDDLRRLKLYSKKIKIDFLLSVFDNQSIENLKKLKLKTIKIPSGELNNYIILSKLASFKKIILSSGISTENEINECLSFLRKIGVKKNKITLLHCNSAYPTPNIDANLNTIPYLKKKFKINIGYSDHTQSVISPAIAVALGAKIIEKHITLDKKMNGPDHSSSFDEKDFKLMIKYINEAELLIGVKKKIITKSEKVNKKFVKKYIIASKNIEKNEKFNFNNLDTMRTGKGILASKLILLVGKKSKKSYKTQEIIYE